MIFFSSSNFVICAQCDSPNGTAQRKTKVIGVERKQQEKKVVEN